MGEKSFDESKYQRLIADYCQTNHHEILVNQEDVIDSIYSHMGLRLNVPAKHLKSIFLHAI